MYVYEISADRDRIKQELVSIGVDEYAYKMVEKGLSFNILVKNIKSPAANILKQEAIASGMDAAVKRGVISCSVEYSNVLLLGNRNTYYRLIKRLVNQPFNLKELAKQIKKILLTKKRNFFKSKDNIYNLDSPMIMGILNVTPDSFFDGGKYIDFNVAKDKFDELITDGAEIIDIGGMSSRLGADIIDYNDEINRISQIIEYGVNKNILLSIDTNNYKTAEYAVEKGVGLINDITGLSCDNMARLCADTKVAICIMHSKGNSQNMNQYENYENILLEIKDYFYERIDKALKFGISEESIILDVGFGFAKNKKHNFILLKYLKEFNFFGMPLLSGLSRKSMIGLATSKNVDDRLTGTIVANTVALLAGTDILRVHDVKECYDTIKVVNSILKV